ncbi:hypothetical protein [Gluconobacter cerinus]|uniref:hypothetical protein n=1 Tax=Gluconobacter cerinus TaxID=38307 RepID=UPI001C0543D6|nr:hypothetical protein [Gluconobacter cerinus]
MIETSHSSLVPKQITELLAPGWNAALRHNLPHLLAEQTESNEIAFIGDNDYRERNSENVQNGLISGPFEPLGQKDGVVLRSDPS